MSNEDDSDVPSLSAVERTFMVLDCLSGQASRRMEDIAKGTGLSKATVFRFLHTLERLGYVRCDESGRWAMTLRLFNLGSRALDHIDLIGLARPVAEELRDTIGETVHMGVLDDDQAVYVLKMESKYTIRMHSRVGRHIPLYCTAIGKVLLAWMDEAGRDSALRDCGLVPFTPATVKSRAELEARLAQVRAQGWTADDEEHETGICCLAAPVRDHSGAVAAALSCSWPLFRFDAARKDEYLGHLRRAADEISGRLGWAGDR
jgi:IclR family KDG regulon transcriptional repressor